MSTKIFEEGRTPTISDAKRTLEKQARQLAYDTRYQVKKETGGKKVDPNTMRSLLLTRLQKSTATPEVKARAKQMLLGEEYGNYAKDLASSDLAEAMFKVFVEGVEKNIDLPYLQELNSSSEEKFLVYVYDPKTKNSYTRKATTKKITELRLKGLKVEKTEHGVPREDEAKRGAQTARALGGGKKAKRDYDRDGKLESSSKEHAGAVHNAIQRATGGTPDGKDTRKEEFFADALDQSRTNQKITGKNVNNAALIKVFPEDGSQQDVRTPKAVYAHTEVEGELITEKAKSKAQQRFMALVYSRKKGEMKKGEASPEVEAVAKSMTKKEARKFAKTKHKGLPEKVEEAVVGGSAPNMPPSVVKFVDELPTNIQRTIERFRSTTTPKTKPTSKPKSEQQNTNEESCSPDSQKKDTRGDYAKINVVKNKLRAMGAKNPIVMIASEETVEEGRALGRAGRDDDDNPRGAAVRASSGRGMTMTPARGLGASKPAGDDKARAKRQKDQAKADRIAAAKDRAAEGEDRLSRLVRSVQNSSYEPEGEVIDEIRRSEKEGVGSPERREGPYLVGARQQNRERGEEGGRRWVSGGQGGSRTERGKPKGEEGSQESRMNPPEKTGKYSKMQDRKRGSEMGSRFD